MIPNQKTALSVIGKKILASSKIFDKDIRVVASYILDHPSILTKLDNEGVIDLADASFRICDDCGKLMYEGYCIDNGLNYFCSGCCLHKHYTPEEFTAMYADGEGNSYFTSWVD